MTHKFRFYVPSQPSNINVYIDIVIVAPSASEGARMALEHVKQFAPNAEPDSHSIIDYSE